MLVLLAALWRATALQAALCAGAASAAAASVVLPHAPASFANAVPEAAKYADRKAPPGAAKLGLKNREADGADVETPELRLCGAAPNCFSTTPDSFSPGGPLLREGAGKTGGPYPTSTP